MSDIAYEELARAQKLFKDLVWDVVINAQLTALFIAYPALAIWPIQPIIRGLTSMFAGKIFDGLKLFMDVTAIRLVNVEHMSAFNKCLVTLKIVAHDKGIDSKEFNDAKENAKKALSAFVRFGAA